MNDDFISRCMKLIILLAALLLLFISNTYAATLTVGTTYTCSETGLKTAVSDARNGDTITFANNCTFISIFTDDELVIGKNLTIDGDLNNDDTPDVTLDGSSDGRVVLIEESSVVTLDGLTIQNGNLGFSFTGGGIRNEGTLTVTNSTIRNNTASFGGGIGSTGTLTVINSTVHNNVANNGFNGGGIYSGGPNAGTVTIINSTIRDNQADSLGGGIFNSGDSPIIGVLTVIDSTIIRNTAGARANTSGSGGGIFSSGVTTIVNSNISDNDARRGGGISFDLFSNFEGDLTITNSIINDNSSEALGGGILSGDPVKITNSRVEGNSADSGGGISNQLAMLQVTNSSISNNTATSLGGGIYTFASEVTLTNITISRNNTDGTGGGIHVSDLDEPLGELTIQNTILANSVSGGDAFVESGVPIIIAGTNIVEDLPSAVDGVINADPLLDENLIPQVGSPAINAGDNNLVATEASLNLDFNRDNDKADAIPDLAGNSRTVFGAVDIGAYESTDILILDVNDDGIITPSDAMYVINRIGMNAPEADINNDNQVTEADVQAFFEAGGG